MAKKIRSKGGVLNIGRVYPHRKGWRVQVKIFKVRCGPLRSNQEDANTDLEILQRSGGRKEMQRLLTKLHRRVGQDKKNKKDEQKARQKLQTVQRKAEQEREKRLFSPRIKENWLQIRSWLHQREDELKKMPEPNPLQDTFKGRWATEASLAWVKKRKEVEDLRRRFGELGGEYKWEYDATHYVIEERQEAERNELEEELEYQRELKNKRRKHEDREGEKATKRKKEAVRIWLEQLSEAP